MTSWFGARLNPDPPPGPVPLSRSQQRRHDGSPTNFPSVSHVHRLPAGCKNVLLTPHRLQSRVRWEDPQQTLLCIQSTPSKQDSKPPLTSLSMDPWAGRIGLYLLKKASEVCTEEPCQCSSAAVMILIFFLMISPWPNAIFFKLRIFQKAPG